MEVSRECKEFYSVLSKKLMLPVEYYKQMKEDFCKNYLETMLKKIWDEVNSLKFTCKTVRKRGKIIRRVECFYKGNRYSLVYVVGKIEEPIGVLNFKRDYKMLENRLIKQLLLTPLKVAKKAGDGLRKTEKVSKELNKLEGKFKDILKRMDVKTNCHLVTNLTFPVKKKGKS